jgi:hypothetical protein
VAALMIPGDDPELAGAALAALLIAAGRDGAWHQGWADAGTALQARRHGGDRQPAGRARPAGPAGRRPGRRRDDGGEEGGHGSRPAGESQDGPAGSRRPA